MRLRKKLKSWHMMPLSIIALILVALFVWFFRGDFTTRDIVLSIEGPNQIENGKLETFFVIVKNNSARDIEGVNLFVEIPSSFTLKDEEVFKNAISRVAAGQEQRVEFSIIASSDQTKEQMTARIDYSPNNVSARFVNVTKHEVIIGKLDVTIIFDLPQSIYAQQTVEGTIHVIANSDIETSPIYLKLNFPENFKLQDTNQDFDYETVWKLGNLKQGDSIKREFLGRTQGGESSYKFSLQLGKLDGVTFLPLNSVEKEIEVSKSPIFLEQELRQPTSDFVNTGDEVILDILYTNKSQEPLEDVVIRAIISRDLIDTSSISSLGARIDGEAGELEWDKNTHSRLRFIDVGDSGEFRVSFRLNENILPDNVNDTEKIIVVDTQIKSEKQDLSLGGTVLQANNKLNIPLATKLSLDQSILKNFSDNNSYNVRWELENTVNAVRSTRVEAVLGSGVIWQDSFAPSAENVEFVSETNTVVWAVGNLDVGVGNIFPRRIVEFKVKMTPTETTYILGQTKLTGVDAFIGVFLEQDIGEAGSDIQD